MVTGASRGLGLEFVTQMLAFPSPPEVVIAACRNPSSATNLQAIAKSDHRLKIISLDVEKDEDIEKAFQETQSFVGEKGLNILINNAGFYDQSNNGRLQDVTRESMQKHFNINVSGQLMVIQKFLPLLELAISNRGSKDLNCQAEVVMLSSIAGSQNLTYQAGLLSCLHYKCSKSAGTMASILLSRELRSAGIHVLSLHPGWVRTDMGGPEANLSVEESFSGCLKVIGSASANTTGKFLDYSGAELPY
ncbi:C-factor-like [Elysia marginata]|uniref:C-factor-like n=1 Tax=Elysia marginata TaxID=1093978 RepID=A0AAV4ERB4_9GAST|nr:C-factor-like [Elysia marginata]